jgi:hypothetical protein
MATFQSRVARVQPAVMLRSASQTSLPAASSNGKCPRVLMILRSRAFTLPMQFEVTIAFLRSAIELPMVRTAENPDGLRLFRYATRKNFYRHAKLLATNGVTSYFRLIRKSSGRISRFLEHWQYACEHLQTQILLIAQSVCTTLDDADLVVETFDEPVGTFHRKCAYRVMVDNGRPVGSARPRDGYLDFSLL